MKVAIRQLPGGWQVGVKEARGKTFVPVFNGYLYTKAQASLAAANLERDIQRHGEAVLEPKKNPTNRTKAVKAARKTQNAEVFLVEYSTGAVYASGKKAWFRVGVYNNLPLAEKVAKAWAKEHPSQSVRIDSAPVE